MTTPIRIHDLTPRCHIPRCSRCRPAEAPPELLEAVRRLRRAAAPAPRTAFFAFGFIAGDDQ